ncbi:MFS transporter [Polyangium aurulentum]|uniref:MFS transporter n=1 Tax=Polyangium aurulentum TaxID=2567896 RepID=UPI0010AE0DFC|nr:MFS transporter [Polyangium aurulentum]UQA54552.1 MFS transporter [Polyangium aurulentum]
MTNTSMPIEERPARERVRDRVLLVVVLTVFLDLIGFGITIPLLPYYAESMHASVQVVGLILSSYSAAQFWATPVLGMLSDRYGRRRIILFSLAGNAASMLLFAAATHYKILYLLFASRIVAGATAGNLSACQAAIADVTVPEERAWAMGRLGAGIGLGMALGPFVASLLSGWGPSAPPLAAGALALLDMVLAAILMPETNPQSAPKPVPEAVSAYRGPQKEGRAKRPPLWEVIGGDRRVLVVLVLYFLTFMAMSSMNVALPVLAKRRFSWDVDQIGYIFGMFGAVGLVIQGFMIQRLAKVFGEIMLVVIASILIATGMVMVAMSGTSTLLVAGILTLAVGIAINNPSISSLASKYASPEHRGATLGFAQSAGTLARTIGPVWAGFLFDKVSAGAPFLGSAIAAALMLMVVTGLSRMKTEPAPEGAR